MENDERKHEKKKKKKELEKKLFICKLQCSLTEWYHFSMQLNFCEGRMLPVQAIDAAPDARR